MGTPAFRSIFRSAVEEAHRTAVSRHAGQATLEMGETLKMLTSTAAVTSPGLADALENQASSLLIDAAPVLDRLDLWRVGERVRWVDEAAAVLTVALFAGAVVADRDRRRAVLADRRGRRGRGSRGRARHVDRAEGGLGPASATPRWPGRCEAWPPASRPTWSCSGCGWWSSASWWLPPRPPPGRRTSTRDLRRQLQRAGRWVTTTRRRAAGRGSRPDRPGDRRAPRHGAGAVAGRVGRWHRRRLRRHDLGRARPARARAGAIGEQARSGAGGRRARGRDRSSDDPATGRRRDRAGARHRPRGGGPGCAPRERPRLGPRVGHAGVQRLGRLLRPAARPGRAAGLAQLHVGRVRPGLAVRREPHRHPDPAGVRHQGPAGEVALRHAHRRRHRRRGAGRHRHRRGGRQRPAGRGRRAVGRGGGQGPAAGDHASRRPQHRARSTSATSTARSARRSSPTRSSTSAASSTATPARW